MEPQRTYAEGGGLLSGNTVLGQIDPCGKCNTAAIRASVELVIDSFVVSGKVEVTTRLEETLGLLSYISDLCLEFARLGP
jgi:hypothetical protein